MRDPTAVRPERGSTFRSFTHRNFRLFFTGQLISQIGNWLTLVAQTLLVLELTDSGVALGVLAAAQFGPVLLLGAFAGLVADRSDKRTLLIRVQMFAMAQSIILGFLAWHGDVPVWTIYVVAAFGGVATAFDNPARRSFVVEMVPESEITNAVSLNSAVMTGSRIVGPALAGLLVSTVGFAWAFWLDAVSYVAVIAGLRMIDPTKLRLPERTGRGKGQIRAGLRYAWSVTNLRVPLLMMVIVGTFAFNFQTVLPLLVKRDLGGTDLTFSILMSVVSVGSLVGALLAARRTTISLQTVTVSTLAFGLGMAILAVSPNQPAAFAFGAMMGLASITFMTASTAIVQLEAAPQMRGRVLALQSMVFLGSTPIGGPIVGTISEHVGARWGVAVGAVACLVAAGYGAIAGRPLVPVARRLEAAAAGPVSETVDESDAQPGGAARGSLR